MTYLELIAILSDMVENEEVNQFDEISVEDIQKIFQEDKGE